MIDFGALPPEVNSGRMYAGAGSGPILAAATAWDTLAAELGSVSASYQAVVSELTGGSWLGPASASMAAAATPYTAWLSTTAEEARQTADQARSAAAAYEAAFAATVPPPVIEQNRALLMSLVATNLFGQNSAAIAATQMHYAEMWAQDATAMYGYAGSSAAASTLTPFTAPPRNTDPAGTGAQAAAVSQATGTAAATHSTTLSQLISAVPTMLRGLASSGSTTGLGSLLGSGSAASSSVTPNLASITSSLNFLSGGTFVGSGILFILGPVLEGPIIGATHHLGAMGAGLGAAGAGASGVASVGGAGLSGGLGNPAVLAGTGRAASVGGLSVPHAWAKAVPAVSRTATALPEPALAGMAETGVGGMGPMYGGTLPGSLMAAAAGGGGAAGGSWAAQRGGAAAQRAGGGAARYGPRASVVPSVDREAGPPDGVAHRPLGQGEEPSNDSMRDELNELRRQIAELAMERDVLMRSAALWAREAMGR